MTRATMEVHHFFSNTTPQFDKLKTSPKTDFGENKNLLHAGLKMAGTRYATRIVDKKNQWGVFFDDSISRLRSPVIQKPFSPKNGIPLL